MIRNIIFISVDSETPFFAVHGCNLIIAIQVLFAKRAAMITAICGITNWVGRTVGFLL
jgi:hypothetical protein